MSKIKIHTYASKPEAFLVNSFIIETDNVLILIDTQFLVTPAREVKNLIEKIGKPLAGIFITHPHPDHFNGVSVILENKPNVPVYATADTLKFIQATDAQKRSLWTPKYGDEYPKITRFPNHIVKSQELIIIDGFRIVVDDLGIGESSDMTVVSLPEEKVVFVSDLVYNGIHPWLAEGHSNEWINNIDSVYNRYGDYKQFFVGHGSSGDKQNLLIQKDYISFFQNLIRKAVTKGQLNHSDKNDIKQKIKSQYPDYALDFLIDMNIDGVFQELQKV